MIFLRQSTASQEILLGPFLDDTDGKTAETALTIANTDIKVWKTGGTTESNKNSGGATHIASGRYYAVFDATDTNTIGPLEVNVHVSGALPVKAKCCVLDEAVHDVLFGTTAPSTYAGGDTSGTTTLLSRIGSALTITSGRVNADLTHIATAAVSTSTAQLGVNVVNFGGSAGSFASGRPAVNASYIGGVPVTATTSITFPSTCTVATTTGAVGSVTGAVGSVTGAVGSVTGAVGSVTGAVGSVTGNVGGNVTGSVGSIATGGIAATSFAAGAINAAAIATGAIDADALATDAVTEIWAGSTAPSAATIADAVWDEDATGHQTQGTFGQAIGDPVADTNTIFKAVVTDATGATVGVDVAAVLDDTGTAGVVVASLAAGSITAATIATGAIDADALAADAGTEIGTAVWATATRVLTAGTNIDGSTFTAIPWNAAWDAEVQSEVQDAIEVNHLDHLLAVTYDPASKPGAADALLNELVESDAGVARYTANALEQAPTGGSAPTASQIADEVQTRTIAGVTLVATTTNLTNLPTIPANWLTASGTAADFGSEIGTAVRTELATELSRIDAAITTRMATYTQPTGFLAATFPTTVASTTNITAGTITTVTTLTNLPAITSNWLTAAGLAADAGVEIAAAVWDRVLSGATHNIASSAGRRLRQLDASSIASGTVAAGASNSITLDGTASATDDIYDENLIVITGGTGVGQTRVIVEYNGTTKVAIVNRVWQTNPSTDSTYDIIAGAQADIAQHGLAQGGTASTITLSTAASAVDDIYIGSQVYISTSTGTGQTRLITDYNGTTKVATVSPDWVTNPTSASVYKVIPIGRAIVDSGTVTTVTGAVGSVTGNVGGNVVGSVASVTGNVGGNVTGSVGSVLGGINTTGGTITTLDALDTAQDSQHNTTQTAIADVPTNAELATALGTADDTVLAAIATLQTYVDTEVAAIKAKTDNLPTDPADASDIAASFASIASSIATLQTYVDTEVAAIKAKTDSLTFTVAGQVDANIQYVNDTQVEGTGTTGNEWGPV